ncbi:MAG: hypothetical protein O2960_14200 [Verrucomicrobia bacterium]|nr:hypothetical protein [Verrucomicrobiota bacterium]
MRTTIDLPDQLFHRAKLIAAQRHTTLKELISNSLQRALDADNVVQERMVSPPIRMNLSTPVPALSKAELEDLVVNDDMAKSQAR